MATANQNLKLTDPVSITIVEHYQREVGDRTAGRTLTRIIQTFHAAGMRLTPEAPAPEERTPEHHNAQTA